MKLPKVLTSLAAAALMLVASANASAAPSEFAEGVDWTKQVVTVTGEGIVPSDAVNYRQARGMASRAAKADAYRKLGELINGVRVEGETTVEKMATVEDRIRLRVSATVKGAKILQENFLSDGGYSVVMQVPLFGVSNSLAGAVFEQTSTIEPFPNPVEDVAPALPLYNSSTPVTRRIELASQNKITIEESVTPSTTTYFAPPLSGKSVSTLDSLILEKLEANTLNIAEPTLQPTAPVTNQRSVEDYASAAQGDYTGLIVDCRGLGLQPVMSPVIKNTNGTKIYGHKNLDIDRVIREGMADYAVDGKFVGRAGDNPLVVKAKSVANFNSNPVLSIPDSNRVLIENHSTKFLKDLKVVFLRD